MGQPQVLADALRQTGFKPADCDGTPTAVANPARIAQASA